jgi:hypothetical protein
MFSSLRPFSFTAVFFALLGPALAQEGAPPDELAALPRMIRTQVEFIEVTHEKFTELTFGPHSSSNNNNLRQDLAELVKDGEAKVAETMMCIARSGQRSSTDSTNELIYPTEYDGPEVPNTVQITSASDEPPSLTRGLGGPPKPTSFETRNIGSSLETEPTICVDNRMIDVRFACEITQHCGDTTWAEWNDDQGDASIRMPNFYSARVNTASTVMAGEYTLVASVTPKDDDGNADFSRKWMVFLKCDILIVGIPGVARQAPAPNLHNGTELAQTSHEPRARD